MIFFISFWSWDLSAAHFNSAVTVGRLVKEIIIDFKKQKMVKTNIEIALKLIFV